MPDCRDRSPPRWLKTPTASFGAGTESGLARWDGYRFRVYKPVAGQAGALPDSWVQALHTVSRGRLWIGTNSGGLARYDRDADRFITYVPGPKGLSNGYVHAIADDGEGGLRIGTDGGLDHLAPDSGALVHYRHDDKDSASLPGNRVSSIMRDRRGELWGGTDAGVVRRAPGSNTFTPVALPALTGQVEFVRSLLEDSRGRIWAGTMGHGAYVIAADAARPARSSTAMLRSRCRPSGCWGSGPMPAATSG